MGARLSEARQAFHAAFPLTEALWCGGRVPVWWSAWNWRISSASLTCCSARSSTIVRLNRLQVEQAASELPSPPQQLPRCTVRRVHCQHCYCSAALLPSLPPGLTGCRMKLMG